MSKILYADFKGRGLTASSRNRKERKEDDRATMVRVRTPNGFDYVKKNMLPFLIGKGHVISEA